MKAILGGISRGLLWVIGLGREEKARLPEPPPDGFARLHLFNGDMGEEALMAYCFDAPDNDTPEPFTNDLPEAYVDTEHLEVRHHPDAAIALNGLGLAKDDLARLVAEAEGAGWIIAAEPAWGGFAYRLHDTPKVRYLGAVLVST